MTCNLICREALLNRSGVLFLRNNFGAVILIGLLHRQILMSDILRYEGPFVLFLRGLKITAILKIDLLEVLIFSLILLNYGRKADKLKKAKITFYLLVLAILGSKVLKFHYQRRRTTNLYMQIGSKARISHELCFTW